MDWKARLKNKTFVVSMLAAIVAFIYQVLGILGVAAPITQDEVLQAAGILINLLVGLGILVDPTTSGITDGESNPAEKKE